MFWILLGVTAFEVMLGILKVDGYLPDFLVFDTFLGLAWLTHIFIVFYIELLYNMVDYCIICLLSYRIFILD